MPSSTASRAVARSVAGAVTSGRTSSRAVIASVYPIHTATAATKSPNRRAGRVRGGSPAKRSATPVTNGFVGPKAEPTTAEPTLMASAVMAPNPSPRDSTSNTGMSAMISSCMFSSAPSVANTIASATRTSRGRCVRPTRDPTSRPRAPVASSSAKAPPTNRITTMTSAPAMMPRGTASNVAMGPTGACATRLYVPATTTSRPVASSVRRSYEPAGRIQVRMAAMNTVPSRSTSACGRRRRMEAYRFSSMRAIEFPSESRNSASQSSWSGILAIRCGTPTTWTPAVFRDSTMCSIPWTKK